MGDNAGPVKKLPPIGAFAFIILLLSAIFALVRWDWTFFAVGVVVFLILAVWDARQVGKGE